MPNPINITNIPPPRVDFIDPRTGLIAREWYRFLFNQFKLTGSGTNETSLTDLQIGPPPINSVLGEINTSFDQSQIAAMSDQAEVVLGQLGLVYDQAQLASMIAQYEQATFNLQNQFDTAPAASQIGTIASYNLDGSPTAGGVGYGTGSAVAFTPAGTSGQFLTSAAAGTPTWASPSSVAVTSFSAGTTGLTPATATTGAITLAGTLAVANGGTGVTSSTGSGSVVLSTSPTIATPTITTSVTSPIYIGGTGTTSTLALRSTSGVGTTGADIIFQTGNNGSTEAMRILNSGVVGIGTSAPSSIGSGFGTLEVSGSTGGGVRFSRTAATATTGYIAALSGAFRVAVVDNLPLTFFTQNIERVRIDGSGNVGIGTSAPDYKLKIEQGLSNSSNGLFISNTNYGSMQGLNISMVNAGFANFGSYAVIKGYKSGVSGITHISLQPDEGNVGIGTTTNLSTLTVNGSFASKSPSTVNAATYTVAATDGSLRFTTTNCTVTLPAAASFPGRILYLNTITANSVISASANVIPLGSNTAGTAILAATAGKFAMLQSDGTNWITMLAN